MRGEYGATESIQNIQGTRQYSNSFKECVMLNSNFKVDCAWLYFFGDEMRKAFIELPKSFEMT